MAETKIGILIFVDGAKQATAAINSVTSSIKGLGKTAETAPKSISQLGKSITDVGKSMSQTGVKMTARLTAPVVAGFGAMIKTGIDFEDSFVGVTKTVDETIVNFDELVRRGVVPATASMEEAKAAALALGLEYGSLTPKGEVLKQSLLDMSLEIPVSPDALASLGQLSGQMGVAVEDVDSMVEVLAKLQVATDLTTEDQLQSFAQIASIAGLSAVEYEKLGATIVAMGNNFPTTESKIVDFTRRIVGTTEAFDISTDSAVGWATAVTSAGIRPEAGATAYRKALQTMALASITAEEGAIDNTAAMEEQVDVLESLQNKMSILTLKQGEYTDKTKESTKARDDFAIQNLQEQYALETGALVTLKEQQGKTFVGGSEELKVFAAIGTEAFNAMGLSAKKFTNKFGLASDALDDGVISSKEFADAFDKDASKSLELFVAGLSDMEGSEAIQWLDAAGLGAQRVGQTIQNLAAAYDDPSKGLTATLESANNAWEQGIALDQEAETAFASMKNQVKLLKNSFSVLSISVLELVEDDLRNLISGITEVVTKFTELDDSTKKTILIIAGIAAAIGPVLVIIGTLVTAFGEIVTAIGFVGGLPVIAAVAAIGTIIAIIVAAIGPENIFNFIKTSLGEIKDAVTPAVEKMREIKDTIEDVLSGDKTFLDLFPPELQDNVQSIIDNITTIKDTIAEFEFPTDSINEFKDTFDELANTTFGGFKEDVDNAIANLTVFIDMVSTSLAPIIEELKPLAEEVAAIFSMETTEALKQMEPAFTAIKDALIAMEPALKFLAIFLGATFIAAFVIVAATIGVLIIVIGVVIRVVATLINVFSQLASNTITAVVNTFRILWEVILIVWNTFKGLVGIITGNKELIEDANEEIKKSFVNMKDIVVETLESLEETVKNIADAIVQLFGFKDAGEKFDEFVEGIIQVAEDLLDILVGNSIFPDMVDGILGEFADLAIKGVESFNDLFSGVTEVADKLAGAIANTAADIVGSMDNMRNSITSSPTLTIQHPFENFVDFMDKEFSGTVNNNLDTALAPLMSAQTNAPAVNSVANSVTNNNPTDINISGVPINNEQDAASLMLDALLQAG